MGFFAALLPLLSASSRWDTEGAAAAFERARDMRTELAVKPEPSLDQYLECARTFRKVHVRDPHFSRTGDAIYEEAVVYQEMGDRFSDTGYYRIALKRFQLLVEDYGGSQHCPDALLRMGDIYLHPLKDASSAQNAYRMLKTHYSASPASRRLLARDRAPDAIRPLPAAPQAAPAPVSTVRSIRHWSTQDYTRVTIDLDAAAHFIKKRITNPDRIYFDVSRARIGTGMSTKPIRVEDRLLKQIRIGQNEPEKVRIVLELGSASNHSVAELYDPYRIVIDLRAPGPPDPGSGQNSPAAPVSAAARPDTPRKQPRQPPKAVTGLTPLPSGEARTHAAAPGRKNSAAQAEAVSVAPGKPVSAAAAASPGEPAPSTAARKAPAPAEAALGAQPTSLGNRTLTRMLGLKIGRIVLDPGHGGDDLGTVGPGGLLEKDLVLSIALELKPLLEEKLGAEVLITRTDDSFVSLEERAQMANDFRADLFLSIHANSSRSRATSGVETYYLHFAKTSAEREVASRENAASTARVSELEDMVKRIAQADKSAESRELAAIVQKKLYAGTRKLFPESQNRGVRSAPFIVLIGANMPSVLTEVAFLSNPRDEKLLKKSRNQEKLVQALFSGIEGYMQTLGGDLARNRPAGN